MNAPPLQTLHVPPRPHWTDPESREETLARREKFQKVDWRPLNHKPKTKRAIAYAKRVWDRYVTCCESPLPVYCQGVSVWPMGLPPVVIIGNRPHLPGPSHGAVLHGDVSRSQNRKSSS